MFTLTSAPSRLTSRLAGARARRRTLSADRAGLGSGRTSLGETLAIGLRCDGWKPRRP